MEKKRSGWRTAGLIAGVGCLSIIAVIVGGVVIAAIYARATLANLGDPDPRPVDRRIALPSSVDIQAEHDATRSGATRGAPLHVTLDLREGEFTVRPGEPGSEIQVQGEYAPGLYELTESQNTDPATGVRRLVIRFRSKAPAWARFFAGFGGDAGDAPKLTVIIPRGSPIDLDLQMTMGRSEVDLGGLTLGEVSLNASMGEHRIDFHEPVVEGVRRLHINTSMGNVVIENLGNARADAINATGSMGNMTASLGGAWPPGATANLTFEQSMGELTLRVPSSVRLDASVTDSQGATTNRPEDVKPPDDPNAPTLRLRVKSSMGETRVIRY
jgi:hypothetical protein